MTRPGPVEILRQVQDTESRPLRTLPPEWYEDGVAERMAAYIERHEPEAVTS